MLRSRGGAGGALVDNGTAPAPGAPGTRALLPPLPGALPERLLTSRWES